MTDNQFIYTVTEPGPRAFTMPDGFQGTVEIHLWGAGGGSASSAITTTTYYNWYNGLGTFIGQYTYASTVSFGAQTFNNGYVYGYSRVASSTTRSAPSSKGGGGGYVKAIVNVEAGDIIEIGLGLVGADANKTNPGMGGSSSVGARYSGGPGGGSTTGAGGGGGGATVVLVNGTPVAVAAGGGGGGLNSVGKAGGVYTNLTTNTQGKSGTSTSGGGGGGYLGGGIEQGGQNFGTIVENGSGVVVGGKSAPYYPAGNYGNAGYNGYAVLVFTRAFQLLQKDSGDWKPITKAYTKIADHLVPYTPITPPVSQAYTSIGATTFTVPPRVYSINVVGHGGAGGGGGGDAGKNYNGPGTGGGGTNKKTQVINVTPGQILTVTVGKGGAGGPVGGDGQDGLPSSVSGNGVSFVTGAGTHGGGYYTGREAGIGADGATNGGIPTAGRSTNGGANGGGGGGFKAGGGTGGNGAVTLTYTQVAETVLVNNGGWKEIDKVFIKNNGAWKPLQSVTAINDGRSKKYVTPGNYVWTAPADVTRVKVSVYGAGGSGTGGGGGAGGFADSYITVTPGNQYTITVGAGGVNSGAGQASSFNGTINALGGNAGAPANSGTSAGGAGGIATGGTTNLTGQAGSSGKALFSYWYWWHGWGGYYGWGGHNYFTYGYNTYNYYWRYGYYATGYYGWGWPSYYRQSGYDFGEPGVGYDRIGSGAVGPASNTPKGASGAVFILF